MREFKFRTWDKKEKSMHTVYNFDAVGSGINPWILVDTGDGREVHAPFKKDRFVLMQFTGLQDKNGKDIYEGDIVKWHIKGHAIDERTVIGEVKKVGISLCLNSKTVFEPIYKYCHTPATLEILGNIFENKELLKVKEIKHACQIKNFHLITVAQLIACNIDHKVQWCNECPQYKRKNFKQ